MLRLVVARAAAIFALTGSALAWSCLSTLAPSVRATGPHAGMDALPPADDPASSRSAACMSCHPSPATARELVAQGRLESDPRAQVPIVADWMLEDERACVSCHQVRSPRGIARGHE